MIGPSLVTSKTKSSAARFGKSGNFRHAGDVPMRMKKFATLALVVAVLMPAVTSAQAKVLTGQWLATFTMTRPDGTQSITFDFHLTQKGKVLTGTVGPDAERQWKIEKGVVDGAKVTFEAQQPEGPLRKYSLMLVKDRLQGTQRLEFQGRTAETTVDAVRSK